MNKPRLEDKDKVAKVYNSKGEVCETFSFRDHGNSYLSAAQNYLMQNYDKLMSESNDYIRRRTTWEDEIAGKKPPAKQKPPAKRKPRPQTDYEKMRKERKEQGLDEEVEQMDEVSGSLAGRYAVAARKKEEEEKKKDQEFVQQMKDAGMKGIGTPLRHKGPHFGKASRENMIKLAINKLTNPDFPVSNRVKVPATESVKIDEAYTVKLTKTNRRWDVKDDIGQPIHAVDRHYDIHDENGKKVGEVLHHYNQYGGHFYNGHIHGSNIPYDRQKITDLKQNAQAFINGVEKTKWHSKLLERTAKRQQKQQQKEEVEQQMDEAHKINDPVEIVKGPGKGTKGYIGEIRHGLYKGAPKRYTVFHGEHGATQVDKEDIRKIKEEVEQMDESSGKRLGKYIVDARNEEEKKRKEEQEFVQQMRDAGLKGIGAPLRKKGAQAGKASRANMIKLAVNKLTNKGVKVPATESVELEESEKVEQMDESSGDAPINKMSHKDLADYIGKHPKWVENNREEAEDMAHEKTENLQEKLTKDMSLADVIRDFVRSDDKRFRGKSKEERIEMAKGAYYGMHENKIYGNIITKLEEGRLATPPKPGKKPSAAWLRHLERVKASGGSEPEKKKEPEHVVAQILKHQDYGYKDHEYTFHDGSKLNVTPQQRDKIIRKIQSLTGPGKNPDARQKLYDELNTRKGFLHHTGDEPIPAEKLHPMSAQKK